MEVPDTSSYGFLPGFPSLVFKAGRLHQPQLDPQVSDKEVLDK